MSQALKSVRAGVLLLVLGHGALPVMGMDFSYSGFLNVTAGRVFSGSGYDDGTYPLRENFTHCPCVITDWGQGSVYGTKWTAGPESRLGLQGTANFTSDFSFTGQLVARTVVQRTELGVEWAYLSYNITPKVTVQAGRKRVPLFFYSDFQDVSFAYSWARVPPDIYGWPVVNYNGVNLTYRDEFGSWGFKSNIYVGSEHSKDTAYNHIFATDRGDTNWTRMRGIDFELTRDWFSARLSINKSRQQGFHPDADTGQMTPGASVPYTYTSLAMGADKDNLVVRTEFAKIRGKPQGADYYGFIVGAGYRIGKFTPMLTLSGLLNYYDSDSPALSENDRTVIYTLRYQVDDSSSFKAQIDAVKIGWHGEALSHTPATRRKLLSLSYERVF